MRDASLAAVTANSRLAIALALTAGLTFALLSVWRRVRESRLRRLYTERLSQCLSPRSLERLVQAGSVIKAPDTRAERVSVLMAETLPAEVASIERCIHVSDGTIAEVEGGSFVAFWNMPVRQENHAARACAAALRWRKQNAGSGRISIHTGLATIETRDLNDRLGFLASGDAIDIARFLLRLQEQLGTNILISSSTRKGMEEKFITRRLGDFKVPGRAKPLTVHELIAPKSDEEPTRALRDEFSYALQLFQNGDFVHAALSFERLAEDFPSDKPVQYYLAKVGKLQANPIEGEWDGVIDPEES